MGLPEIKKLCIAKEMVSKLKRTPRVGKIILCLYIRQRTDNQNIQGAQETKLLPNQ
jgi:hypothetical protein